MILKNVESSLQKKCGHTQKLANISIFEKIILNLA